jgi:Tol biopolymer transport system component
VAAAVAYVLTSRTKPPRFQRISLSRLTNTGNSSRAAMSPDGKYVAHIVGEPGQQSLSVRLFGTSSEAEIFPPSGVRCGGLTFSPGSNYIYYVLEEPDGSTPLYRASVFGGEPKKVISQVHSPVSFSPDGSEFAFTREYSGSGESVLLVAKADGTSERPLGSRRLPEFSTYPAWSPDGASIACTVASRSGVRVVEFRLDTRTERPVTDHTWGYAIQLGWLKDGRGLVLSATDSGSGTYSLWHVSYPRGDARKITNDLDSLVGVSTTADPSILISVQENLLTGLWIAHDGKASSARQIVNNAWKYYQPTWTSDGRILYEKQSGANRSIWFMDRDGNSQKQLTIEGNNHNPSVCSGTSRVVYCFSRCRQVRDWNHGYRRR